VDRARNPWFAHGEAGFFVAERNGRVVGRVSASRDRLHDEFHGDRVGFFGHFEATDQDTAKALVDHAAAWCRERSADSLRGPVDLSTNYRCGLLVEGEPGAPMLMMPHNPKHYAQWLEAAGLEKAKDLLALRATKQTLDLSRIDRIVQRVQQKSRAVVRRMNLKRFGDEMRIVWDLYNRIWERNWGFVPMSEAEFFAHSKDLAKVARPELMYIAEIDGKPVGFAAALPDVNRGIKACNGKLLPFGWWKFLSAMKETRTIRVLTLGVVPEHRRDGLQMLVMHAVISQGIAAGFDACEASWILEDNRDMLGPLETLGHVPYRRYRIYTKPLR
jgi:GNAT superfamily N-acetyltransferase